MNREQKEVQQTFLDSEKAVLKRLEANYKEALTDINAKISDVWLPGLQEILNGTITPEELMKKVQEMAAEVKGLAEAGQL